MKLLSPKKSQREKRNEDDEKQVVKLLLERKKLEEGKKISEIKESWEPEKKKMWEDFCRFNQEIQQKKAVLLTEIEELEKKREALVDSIKIHI